MEPLNVSVIGSRFGAVLDMLIDRCTTATLITYLATVMPHYLYWAQLLLALDFASHYAHMYR